MTTRTNNGIRLAAMGIALAFFASAASGCFNTYRVPADEFRKLQTAEDSRQRTIKSKSKTAVLVEETTNIYVRSEGGRRYPITPFNFKMTRSQLVASDRDTLLSLGEIAEYEVDHLSTPLTVGIISAAVVLAGGLIAFTLLTAEED